MHKRTRLALEEIAAALRGPAAPDRKACARLAALAEERLRHEAELFEAQQRELRQAYQVDVRGGIVSSGRINRGAPLRTYAEERAEPGPVRVLSPIERSQPAGDRE